MMNPLESLEEMASPSSIEVLEKYFGNVLSHTKTFHVGKTTSVKMLNKLFGTCNDQTQIRPNLLLKTFGLHELQYFSGLLGPEIVKSEAKKAVLEICSVFMDELVHTDIFKHLRSVPVTDTTQVFSLVDINNRLWEGYYDDVMDLVNDLWSLEHVDTTNTSMENVILSEFRKALNKIEDGYTDRLSVCCMQLRRKLRYLSCNMCACLILQNNEFYEEPTENWIACQRCYNNNTCSSKSLSFSTDNGTQKVPKSKFSKQFNTHQEKEPTVTCNICSRKFHQRCVNFVATPAEPNYLCKACLLCHRESIKYTKPIHLLPPPTPMTDYIEKSVNDSNLEMNHVYVRVISNVSKIHKLCPVVRDFLQTYEIAGEFPYKSRLLMCFQEKDKGLVAFFAMYVQEYDSSCPPPNQNTVNISMVDSVHLFEPKHYRRIVFQTVLLSYLNYVNMQGFKTAFLWACPPQLGTEYIFFHRPVTQQTPTKAILQDWYKFLMQMGVDMGILKKFENLYEWCPKKTAAADFFRHLPYFVDDHWPLEVEGAISSYEELAINRKIQKPGRKSKKGKRIPGDLKNKEEYVLGRVLTALRKNQYSFYCMTFNSPTSCQSSKRFDVEMPSLLADCRDTLVAYFTENSLEFDDIRNAQFSTAVFLTELRFEHPYIFCDVCCEAVFNGVSCEICHFDLCVRCAKGKFAHEHVVNKKNIYGQVPCESFKNIPNKLATWRVCRQNWWTNFKNELCSSDKALKVIHHIMNCTEDNCTPCIRFATLGYFSKYSNKNKKPKYVHQESAQPNSLLGRNSATEKRFISSKKNVVVVEESRNGKVDRENNVLGGKKNIPTLKNDTASFPQHKRHLPTATDNLAKFMALKKPSSTFEENLADVVAETFHKAHSSEGNLYYLPK